MVRVEDIEPIAVTVNDRELVVRRRSDGSLWLDREALAACVGDTEETSRRLAAFLAKVSAEGTGDRWDADWVEFDLACGFWLGEAAAGNDRAVALVRQWMGRSLAALVREVENESEAAARSFDSALDYVLTKNHDLYERLA